MCYHDSSARNMNLTSNFFITGMISVQWIMKYNERNLILFRIIKCTGYRNLYLNQFILVFIISNFLSSKYFPV